MTASRRAAIAFDVVVVVGFALLAGRIWGHCALGSEVAGDSFVPLECGRRWAEQGFTRPGQPIFGWGLCASYAPLFWGADSLWEVAWRRSQVHAAMVPLTYLIVISVVPGWLGAGRIASRVGGLCGASAVLVHETIGRASSTGSHGYFAFTWTAVAFLAWAWATRAPTGGGAVQRGGRALAAALGMVAAPVAMMNHPYTGWLALSAVAFVPLIARRVGVAATAVACALGVAAAWPRVAELRAQMGGGVSASELAHQPGDWALGEGELIGWIFDVRHHTMLLGLLFLAVAAGIAFRAADRERRWIAGTWLAALAGAVLGIAALAEFVGYLQDYHVLLAFPIGAVGLGLGGALAVDVVGRTASLAEPGGAWFKRARVALVAVAAVVGTVELGSTADDRGNPFYDPWCVSGPPNGGTAEGSLRLERVIRRDLARVPAGTSALITNLNLSEGRLDSAVPTAFGLVLAGVPPSKLVCCEQGAPPPVWYFIIDVGKPDLDYEAFGEIDGVDVLMRRPEVNELTVVVRTPEALAAVGERLCDAIPSDRTVAVHYYDDVIDLLASSYRDRLVAPPSPVPSCLDRMQ